MSHGADILSQVLDTMRVSGSVLLHEAYTSPWAIEVPDADGLAQLCGYDDSTQMVAFHFVERGFIDLKLQGVDGVDIIRVEAGDIAICFGGKSHRMSQGRARQAMELREVVGGRSVGGEAPRGPSDAVLLCGAFVLRETQLNPLFHALPPVLHTRIINHDRGDLLETVTQLLLHTVARRGDGTAFVAERLIELLCVESIRGHMNRLPERSAGWFRGLADPPIRAALTAVHNAPEDAWTVGALAQRAGLSKSRFAARFRGTLGQSPMSYVTKWRINVATRLLGDGGLGVGEVARRVGYENLAVFSRAFKRLVGESPARWRTLAQQRTTPPDHGMAG